MDSNTYIDRKECPAFNVRVLKNDKNKKYFEPIDTIRAKDLKQVLNFSDQSNVSLCSIEYIQIVNAILTIREVKVYFELEMISPDNT